MECKHKEEDSCCFKEMQSWRGLSWRRCEFSAAAHCHSLKYNRRTLAPRRRLTFDRGLENSPRSSRASSSMEPGVSS